MAGVCVELHRLFSRPMDVKITCSGLRVENVSQFKKQVLNGRIPTLEQYPEVHTTFHFPYRCCYDRHINHIQMCRRTASGIIQQAVRLAHNRGQTRVLSAVLTITATR